MLFCYDYNIVRIAQFFGKGLKHEDLNGRR